MELKLIIDKLRKEALDAIHFRLKLRKSVLITGVYGSGKTTLLNTVNYESVGLTTARWQPLYTVYSNLGQILSELGFLDVSSAWGKIPENMAKLCNKGDVCLKIDEAHHMRKDSWAYLKHIMDEGIPCVFSGLPGVEHDLKKNNPDILSRLRVIHMIKIDEDSIFSNYDGKIEKDAIKHILGFCDVSMRYFFDYLEVVLIKAEEQGVDVIDLDYAYDVLDAYDRECQRNGANGVPESEE